ncbi:GNAT family N-acetyltransferase [Dokdonella sp.]|uniref:GNAT family N-acetyltransferase n=1 Tax=Dokdonella sp. TaxID=2291710 RepID=UPI001B12CAEE|nr:GNAT family N-acetyltransferase [Dokdonella sp.]MBO9663978.1 N-acetyltransferase [Dokdonella sp.]
MAQDYAIVRNDALNRFETTVDGVLCVLDYRLRDGVLTITHTGVPDAVGGRGIAATLTRTAFDAARREGWRVVPACSYAAVWLAKHPEYADLVDRR